MFEKILDVLKTFFEKYFIQALLAIIPTILIYYFTPDDFAFQKKLGKEFYLLFYFIICFLIIEFSCYLYKKIQNKIYFIKQENESQKQSIENNLNYMWNRIDHLPDFEKNLLNYMVDNNNKIITIKGSLNFNDTIWDWFNSTTIISDGTIRGFDIFSLKETDYIESDYVITQYKLKDLVFELLKYSKQKYGRISNFK